MQNNHIKYYFGSFKAANINNCLPEYLLWLKLKSINTENRIYHNHITSTLQRCTSYSKSSISTLIHKMVNKGFLRPLYVRKKFHGYEVVSYTNVWRNVLKLRFRLIKGKFVAEKNFIRITDLTELRDNKKFKSFISGLEINENFQKQRYKHIKKTERKLKYHKYELKKENKKGIETKQREAKIKQLTESKFNKVESISCSKIASLLGYKEKKTGSNVLTMLNKFGFLSYIKRNRIIRIKYKVKNFKDSMFISYGKTYQRFCNSFSFSFCCFLNHCVRNTNRFDTYRNQPILEPYQQS